MAQSLAATCAAIVSSVITSFGDTVTLSRRPATSGGAHVTQTVSCMVCPLSQYSNAPLRLEGYPNANEAETHFFMFPAGTDILEGIDDIIHNGQHYRVLMQDHDTLQDTEVMPFAVAVRID